MAEIENIFIGLLKFTSFVNSLFSVFSTLVTYIILQANYLSTINPSFKNLSKSSEPSNKNEQKSQNSLTNEEKGEYEIEGIHKVKEKDGKFCFSELSRDIGGFSSECINYYKSKNANPSLKSKNGELNWKFLESLSLSNYLFIHNKNNSNSKVANIIIDKSDDNKNENNNNTDFSSIGKLIFKEINWEEEPELPQDEDEDEERICLKYIFPKNINESASSYVNKTKQNKKSKNIPEDADFSFEKETDIDEYDILKQQYKLAIVRKFDNDKSSISKKHTCIVKALNDNKNFTVYSQGDPYEIKAICEEKTVPDNFDDLMESYAKKGEKVLAFCGRTKKMSYLQSQKIERKSCEKNMIFLGLIVYKYDGFKDIS